MNALIRTLVYGLAALCVLLLIGGVTVLHGLNSRKVLSNEKVRDFLLDPESQAYIVAMKKRSAEAPVVHQQAGLNESMLLADLAEISGARHANSLVEELRRRKDSLDERERWIEARESELRTARTDLVRLARQLDARRDEITEINRLEELERARFAEMTAAETKRAGAINQQENARYTEIAKLYELQKGDAWLTLRKLDAKEIARILSLMSEKQAALMLKLAQSDNENNNLVLPIHRALMDIKPSEPTITQLERMAKLYSFMKPDDVLPFLKVSEAKEIAALLNAMSAAGVSRQKRADLLAAMAKDDDRRTKQVTELLQTPPAQP